MILRETGVGMTASDARPDPEWLDPEDFPFTEEEVFQAALLWEDRESARRIAHDTAASERKYVVKRTARRAVMATRSANGETVVFVRGSVGDPTPWLLPALSVLSESCAARVQERMTLLWTQRLESMLLNEKVDVAKRAGLLSSLEKLTSYEGDDSKRRELLMEFRREFMAIPSPTDEMRKTVSDLVESERQAWLALAVESQRRLDASRTPTGSPPPTPPRP